MTVVLVGKGANGNLLVSDAMVTMSDNSILQREYRLKDKISRLSGSNCYCTILGDENVLYGIQILDDWYFQNSKMIDFTDPKIMTEALIAAEKFITVFSKQGHEQATTNGATVYFVSQEKLFEYDIIRKNNTYSINDFRHFDDNEVKINYAGRIEKLNHFQYSLDQYFNKSCEIIENFHNDRKRQSQIDKQRRPLNYDFDNRFCGVIYPCSEEDKVKILLPYKNLSDIIASTASDPNLTWDLIEDDAFTWTPVLE